MDRPLYFACREDRERFCSETQAGEGKIFQCLTQHKDDKQMEPECSKMLSERAGLMVSILLVSHMKSMCLQPSTGCPKIF